MSLTALLTLSSCLAFAPLSPAQDKPAEPKDPKAEGRPGGAKGPGLQDRLQRMAEELKLTEAQKEKLRPIFKEEGEKLRAIFEDQNTPREEKAAKVREIREAGAAKIKPILTEEQLKRWEELRAEAQKKRKQKQQ